ncbi:SGNH/GDSL hydrolase family protein [Haliangium sp.]|uniref:SGNH/GDSL hydrolase family protein n=1 Tax=Haliangium sp. TaxID=2663208 RepID=UPI003D0E935F
MKVTTCSIAVGMIVGIGFAGAAQAAPAKIGAIGDSISAGMDTNDDCGTLISCASQIGEDRGFSWTTGYSMGDSLRNRLGFSATVERQKNGARWDDAVGQAQGILSAGGAHTVTIELGGNDVCRDLNATLPTKAEIAGLINQTFSTLINASASTRPARIIIAETPDVVHLRDTMKNQKNFAFETCQDLWDLNTDALEVNTCDWGFFDFICDFFDLVIEDYVEPLIDVMLAAFDVDFPCGYVLESGSNATKRTLARALNNDINDAIAAAVNQWQGVNGVEIMFADNVYEYQFTVGDVSQLDCFHPSRQGQRNLARTIFAGANLGTGGAVQDSAAPVMLASPPSSAWWVGSGTYRDIHFDFNTNEESSIEVWSYNCDYGQWFFEGTTNESPEAHEFRMTGFNYNLYWQTFVRPTDRNANTGVWYSTGCI